MHPSSTRCAFLLAATLALAAGARAAPPDPASPARPEPGAPPGLRADSTLGAATADDLLDSARGGSDRTTIATTLTGTADGNAAANVTTGSNLIQSGSFANMAGIPIVVQNTGANVLIQNATTINLQLK
jgi:hypothetical protein